MICITTFVTADSVKELTKIQFSLEKIGIIPIWLLVLLEVLVLLAPPKCLG